ncbi:unnamed protein product [Moneuplotes crassus]|uniref:3-hydroxyisobutyryl-CoA hydrolase n=1 Tax=Euplotes crassus TaxID=5936 RepID=A0AAD1XDE0_EUPCR|nr:unnamed protein product [Moneuplotes crassus]
MLSKTSVHSKILKLRSLAKASATARAMSTSVAQPKVITEYLSDEVFEFVMNNPRKHNAIDLDMYDMLWQQLRKWENQEQPTPKVIFVKGAGGQAFACGGDVVSIYEGSLVGQHAPILTEFFYKEYILDYALTQMKPIQISVWNGIVMGGGVGISSLSPIRIATEKTIYAMPETAIGFFTDVGGSYFLSRLNNNISLGLFLGITGHRLKAKDLLKWGVATNYVETSNLPSLYEDVVKHTTQDTSLEQIKEIVDRYSDNDVSELTIPEETINYCFAPKPIHTIVQRLTEVVQGEVEGLDSDFASYWLEAIRKFSPISCGVVTEQILRGQHMNLEDVFKMEYSLARRFAQHGEFFEGVRALLVDKDQNPKWAHSCIEEVTQEEIDAFFERYEDLPTDLPKLYRDDIQFNESDFQ